jgi:hypothetical protein
MSCLFDSLSYFLRYNSNEIRQKICDYLEQNKPIVDGLETNFILSLDGPNYIKNMRKRSEWGGGIEIQAACNLWNLRIIVYNISRGGKKQPIEFIPIDGNYIYTIEITWNGSHYEPVHRK